MSSKRKEKNMTEQKKYELDWGGRKLVIETGKYAPQANGSCIVRYGDTEVMATATMGKTPREGVDFFPLSVEYEEKFYAAGKIKGSRFIKREGRPSDEAVLTARMIDRAIRPLFDDRIRNEVQIVLTVLSIDNENDPDIVGLIGASIALSISDIPWKGPIAGANVGSLGEGFILNPTNEQRENGELFFTVAGDKDKVIMLEAEANEINEDTAAESIFFAQKEMDSVVNLIAKIQKEVGNQKYSVEELQAQQIEGSVEDLNKYFEEAQKFLDERIDEYMFGEIKDTKKSRKDSLAELRDLLKAHLEEKEVPEDMIRVIMNKADKLAELRISEAIVKDNKRVDGRKLTEIRPLASEVGILPRTHGSGLFKRGETHILSIVTLAGPGMEQVLDSMELNGTKRYMHHYNFPPYSVGETGRVGFTGRREIGHGALAEKALVPVLPPKIEFPYTIRVVSEVMSSNGSSSMGSVCGSTLSLMDAGVPIKSPVAGIAMGLAQDTKGNWKVITDLQDLEDGYGGMDFKIAGTEKGITAIQMDTKSDGLTEDIVKQTVNQAREARLEILDSMKKAISEPRKEMSPYSPRIVTIQINPDKIRDLVGPGGKVINEIIDETGVTIDIEQDGQVFICSADKSSLDEAIAKVTNITREIEPGEVVEGEIVRIMDFGAILEFAPGRDGMIHISELAPYRVNKVEDIVKLGDKVKAKVLKVEDGKTSLSIKALQEKGPREDRGGDHGRDRGRKPFFKRNNRDNKRR